MAPQYGHQVRDARRLDRVALLPRRQGLSKRSTSNMIVAPGVSTRRTAATGRCPAELPPAERRTDMASNPRLGDIGEEEEEIQLEPIPAEIPIPEPSPAPAPDGVPA
jgi:hypothetical protein